MGGISTNADPAYDVEFRAVTKRFGTLTAVDAVSLKVRRGEFLSLLGPSGCGKTTSLRLIAGFEQPDEGEILIGGASAVGAPPYKREVNTVFQQYALFPHMSVLDNVAYGLKQRKVGRPERYARAREALELVHMTGRERQRPATLSGGQQQRVALARALVMNPRVLLLDEPRAIYDRPLTPFVADFIGDMNFLVGQVEEAADDGFAVAAGAGIVVRGRGRAVKGTHVRVGIRPERMVAVAGTSGGTANSATAEVITKMYLGDQIQIVAKLAGISDFVVREQRASADPALDTIHPADQIALSWDEAAPLLLGEAAQVATGGQQEES